jgi:hypothetical protein
MTTLIFSIFNSLIIFFWILLIFFPKKRLTISIINYPYIPVLLGFGYIYFMFLTFNGEGANIFEADFSSLNGILDLFLNATPESAAAGWLHYLAFDFWMGAWILKNSKKILIPHIFIILPLLFTFMLGPVGVITYVIISKVYLLKNK